MFVPRENNTKKRFQKPNILRRKPKVPAKPNIVEHESPTVNPLVTATCVSESELAKPKYGRTYGKPVHRLKSDNTVYKDDIISYNTKPSVITSLVPGNSFHTNNNEENAAQTSVNVELFLNDSDSQNNMQFDFDSAVDCHIKHDWCLDFTNGSQEIIIENFNETDMENDFELNSSIAVATRSPKELEPNETTYTATTTQNLTIEYLASGTMNFKCDVPDCNKRFRSEQKLKKHITTHSTDSAVKTTRQTPVECPVKKLSPNDEQVPCGRTFLVRKDLLKHLNEEHTLQDASHVCGECGRCFFFAIGLRAHVRSHGGRAPAPLACAWPGCGRVFRQPCRLREHTRAHTGDKPYPCRYPNCGWSFRTASKLLRHARRHTGERRHACGVCGRAFRRREHLRDHCARHAATAAGKHRCTHAGCLRSFTTLLALFSHMRNIHRVEPVVEDATLADTTQAAGKTFTVTLESPALAPQTSIVDVTGSANLADIHPETDAEVGTFADAEVGTYADAEVGTYADADVGTYADAEVGTYADAEVGTYADADAEVQWHAARTHCTWPLAPREVVDQTVDTQYILEEDVQVEGSESNIYTIRSDLFLHGNVLNEDSEHIPGAGVVVEAEADADAGAASHAIDADLSLLDAHPTIDLMQEELMYTDAAVDESSFRVFLLSGEEIQIV